MIKFKEISLLKRNRKKLKVTYDLVIVWHTKVSDKVIAKIGSYDKNTKILILNVFRLIYWLSKKCYFSYKMLKLFNDVRIFNILL